MEALDLNALEQRRRELLEEEVALQEARVAALQERVADLKRRRVMPGCGRPLGPDNYVSSAEMAQETPYSQAQIDDVMRGAGARVRRLLNRYGRGQMVSYHWGDAQAALQACLGETAELQARAPTVSPGAPSGGL